jgi:toxin CcdB
VVIRQFDVCALKSGQLVVILQTDVSLTTSTVIVAPVVRPTPKEFVDKLNLKINLGEQEYTIRIQEMSAIPPRSIQTVIAHRRDLHEKVMLAVDLLFAGF